MIKSITTNLFYGVVNRNIAFKLSTRQLSTTTSKKRKGGGNNNNDSDNNNNEVYVDKEYESYKIHKPVFIKEVLEILDPKPNKVYIDATFGMGGHTRGILESCKDCYVIAFDRDPNVFEMTKQLRTEFKDRLITINSTFSTMISSLADHNLSHLKISGILYDFGVSSYQIDTADRGFSYKKDLDGPLDMRMNNKNPSQITAATIVNSFPEQSLRDIFFYLGEEKHTKNIASEIIRRRNIEPIVNTSELVNIVESCIPYPAAAKTISRVFRSLRMYVNDELSEVKLGLSQGEQLLEPDCPLVAISFHSMEDRIVKQFFNKSTTETDKPSFKYCLPSPIFPSKQELEWNPRSKSAVIRNALRTSNKPISNTFIY